MGKMFFKKNEVRDFNGMIEVAKSTTSTMPYYMSLNEYLAYIDKSKCTIAAPCDKYKMYYDLIKEDVEALYPLTGLSTAFLDEYEWEWDQLWQIHLALMSNQMYYDQNGYGIVVTYEAKSSSDKRIQSLIDVSRIINPKYDWRVMNQIRMTLSTGADWSEFCDYIDKGVDTLIDKCYDIRQQYGGYTAIRLDVKEATRQYYTKANMAS